MAAALTSKKSLRRDVQPSEIQMGRDAQTCHRAGLEGLPL
jgi:hypothetical protein